jgi:hypothetical protein
MTSLITPMKVGSKGDLKNSKVTKQKSVTNNKDNAAVSSSKSGSGNIIKWPPASSTKSLPALSGRISDLLQHVRGNNYVNDKLKPHPTLGARDTIEFEVNQECKSFECAEDYNSF